MSDETALAKAEPMTVFRDSDGKVSTPAHLAEREAFARMRVMAESVFESRMFPDSVKNESQALVILMTGRELGLQPMAAMRAISVIEGKAELSADLMVALVKRTGTAKFEYDRDIKNGSCKLTATRTDTGETYECTWDRARVERSGVAVGKKGTKFNWKHHEQTMLKHRCDAEACRALWPEVVLGVYTPDELPERQTVDVQDLPLAETQDERVNRALKVVKPATEDEGGGPPPNPRREELVALDARQVDRKLDGALGAIQIDQDLRAVTGGGESAQGTEAGDTGPPAPESETPTGVSASSHEGGDARSAPCPPDAQDEGEPGPSSLPGPAPLSEHEKLVYRWAELSGAHQEQAEALIKEEKTTVEALMADDAMLKEAIETLDTRTKGKAT